MELKKALLLFWQQRQFLIWTLPQRLESKGVEFAAAPPKKPNFFSTILSWVVPPLIFILVLQFFARRSMGGGGAQGALKFY